MQWNLGEVSIRFQGKVAMEKIHFRDALRYFRNIPFSNYETNFPPTHTSLKDQWNPPRNAKAPEIITQGDLDKEPIQA